MADEAGTTPDGVETGCQSQKHRRQPTITNGKRISLQQRPVTGANSAFLLLRVCGNLL